MPAFCQEEKTNIFKRIKDRAKNTTEQRAENAGDKVGNKVGDKADAAVDSLLSGTWFKKKKKNNTKIASKNTNTDNTDEDTTIKTAGNKSNNSFKSYSKFDFVSGEKVLYFENFERLNVGDFPTEFNTNSSGEVVTIEGKADKWLNLTKNGSFVPEKINNLPENFTLEFEVGIDGDPSNNMSGLGLIFTTNADDLLKDAFFERGSSVVYLHPGAAQASINILPLNGSDISNELKMPQWNVEENRFAKVSIWRQKGRLRLYVNETKLLDLPRFFSEQKPYNFSILRSYFNDCNQFIGNIKYAIGLPDTRNKLITEGKFVTTGILFEFQKADVKAESYGIIKEIAAALKDNPTIKIKIIGHTSNDGDANANLTLSKQRSQAVKDVLVNEFGIDASRLETDGRGGAEPMDATNTTTGKANNRRVEFIKL